MAVNVYVHAIELGITGDDTLLLMTPLPHSVGLFLWGGLLTGATMVVHDGFDPERALHVIEARSVSWTFMVPNRLETGLDEFGSVFLPFHGQTEVPNLITTFGKDDTDTRSTLVWTSGWDRPGNLA